MTDHAGLAISRDLVTFIKHRRGEVYLDRTLLAFGKLGIFSLGVFEGPGLIHEELRGA